jgi:hypothetical protein
MAWRPPPDDRRCTAKSKQAGRRCAKWAEPGLDVCRMHGGGTKKAKEKQARFLAAQKAQATAVLYGFPEEVDPLDALLGELHRTAGHVSWLSDEVRRLNSPLAAGPFGVVSTDPMVKLYQAERAHLSRVAADCLKAGVEERRVQLVERQGQLVADVIRRIVTSLGLDPGSEEVRTIVRRELMAVS